MVKIVHLPATGIDTNTLWSLAREMSEQALRGRSVTLRTTRMVKKKTQCVTIEDKKYKLPKYGGRYGKKPVERAQMVDWMEKSLTPVTISIR